MKAWTCLRCEYEWAGRKKKGAVDEIEPLRCPKCGSPYWNRERKAAVTPVVVAAGGNATGRGVSAGKDEADSPVEGVAPAGGGRGPEQPVTPSRVEADELGRKFEALWGRAAPAVNPVVAKLREELGMKVAVEVKPLEVDPEDDPLVFGEEVGQ